MEFIKRVFTIEVILGCMFLGFAFMHYSEGNMIAHYGSLIITFVLFATDTILKEIRK